MNRLGVYDVDAAFDKMSLQTAEEFGLDAILEQLACRAGARALISEATRETSARQETRARGAHDDAPPLLAPRRRALPQMPRVLLVRGHREKTAMCWSRVK